MSIDAVYYAYFKLIKIVTLHTPFLVQTMSVCTFYSALEINGRISEKCESSELNTVM